MARSAAATLLLALGLVLAGCGGREPTTPEVPPPPEACASLYVVAPGNYIIDLAGGAAVVLDPAVREFPLFCAPVTAVKALEDAQAAGRIPPGDWRIYRLEGSFAELVQPAEAGGPSPYALARRTRLADWVDAGASEGGK